MHRTRSVARYVVCASFLAGLGCPQLLEDDFATEDRCAPYGVCDKTCVDVQSDPEHCGSCGQSIDSSQICSMGAAVAAGAGCGARTLCDGGCVDTQSHPYFCGSCDNRCKPGASCRMGSCACAPPKAKDCGDVCRECCSDADCSMDKQCHHGACEVACSPPRSACGNRCVNLRTDAKNCGSCGNDCGMGSSCANGRCS